MQPSSVPSLYLSLRRVMLHLETWMIEIVLTIASFWAAHVLLLNPSAFATWPQSFAIAQRLNAHEALWAMVALMTALFEALGILLGLFGCRSVCFVMRLIGLYGASVFWGVMGGSALIGTPNSMFGIWGLIGAVSALWILVRSPTPTGATHELKQHAAIGKRLAATR